MLTGFLIEYTFFIILNLFQTYLIILRINFQISFSFLLVILYLFYQVSLRLIYSIGIDFLIATTIQIQR